MRDEPASSENAEHEPVRYERDLYGWAVEQAALLRAGRFAEVDTSNITEEIDDIAFRQRNRLETALRLILRNMLKWDYRLNGDQEPGA